MRVLSPSTMRRSSASKVRRGGRDEVKEKSSNMVKYSVRSRVYSKRVLRTQ